MKMLMLINIIAITVCIYEMYVHNKRNKLIKQSKRFYESVYRIQLINEQILIKLKEQDNRVKNKIQ